jgi:hypothetical protein
LLAVPAQTINRNGWISRSAFSRVIGFFIATAIKGIDRYRRQADAEQGDQGVIIRRPQIVQDYNCDPIARVTPRSTVLVICFFSSMLSPLYMSLLLCAL